MRDQARMLPLGKSRVLFDAICTVWDGSVMAMYPRQERLRQELVDLQKWCGIEARPSHLDDCDCVICEPDDAA